MEQERDFKGIWIPKEMWLDTGLSWVEKLFLAELDSLSKNYECYASNEYLASFFNLSKGRVSKIISSLAKKKYIKVHLFYKPGEKTVDFRKIDVLPYGYKQLYPIVENDHTPYGQKQPYPMVENDQEITYNNNSILLYNIIYAKNKYNNNNIYNTTSHFFEEQKKLNTPEQSLCDCDKTDKDKFDPKSDPYLLAKWLEKCISENNPKFPQKESQRQRWAKDIDKMIRIDKLKPDDIAVVIKWCQHDSFWKCNILSGKKLRDKYQQLNMKMLQEKNRRF